jgi:hypothetical protein
MADLPMPEHWQAMYESALKWENDQGQRLHWGEPRPLRKAEKPEPYPIDAFPPIIRDAIEEVANFTQAPVAMVAASALTAISIAVQGRYSVERNNQLRGPASLYLLTVGESGERKTTVDGHFTKAIRQWEADRKLAMAPEETAYRANLEAWEEIGKGIKAQLRKSSPGTRLDSIRNPLVQHELEKPQPPRIPSLLRMDDTPEALALALEKYPVAAVVSAEAGIIFGAHGMNPDSVMRNLSQANVFWEGGHMRRDRSSAQSINIEGMRVTMGLQVQPLVLENFMTKTGSLARGIGYLARFLFAQPESTQGSRFYREPPEGTPALNAFNNRVRFLLDLPIEFDVAGRLIPHYMQLTADAKAQWVQFHDSVEEELSVGRDYFEVRDVASKAADNAARLACCLEVFGDLNGASGITAQTMRDAMRLMNWYMDEAVRFGKLHAVPEVMRHAEAVESFLADHMHKHKRLEVPTRDILVYGPNAVRNKAARDAALEVLMAHNRVVVVRIGRSDAVILNPMAYREWV